MPSRVALAGSVSFSLLLACGLWASAQAAQSITTSPREDQAASATPASAISLGQSLVPLYGPWRFQIGDSPVDPVTGKPLWAEPGFDDSVVLSPSSA
jgi:hypothetical protein